jgi:hypothetical protein
MDSEALAQQLCDRMKKVVPSGIGVSVEGDHLVFRSSYSAGGAGSHACQWLHQGTGSMSERVLQAARLAFGDLQDFVDEETTEPWPGATSPPTPNARIEGGGVIVWFGDQEAPDLEITPLLLGDQ